MENKIDPQQRFFLHMYIFFIIFASNLKRKNMVHFIPKFHTITSKMYEARIKKRGWSIRYYSLDNLMYESVGLYNRYGNYIGEFSSVRKAYEYICKH